MGQFEQRDNEGVLFENRNKKSDKSPSHTGNVKIDGKEYQLAVWEKTSEKGLKLLSIKVSDKKHNTNEEVPF